MAAVVLAEASASAVAVVVATLLVVAAGIVAVSPLSM